MSKKFSKIGRWVAAIIALSGLAFILANVAIDNGASGEVRKIDGYVPWSKETLEIAASIPVQNGGRVKPLSTYAGFTMFSLHGQRKMVFEDKPQKLSWMEWVHRKMTGANDREITVKPTAWLLDTLFRPQFALKQPTFRVDNSSALEAIGVKPRGKRDRYSYEDILPGREKLAELAKTYIALDETKRDPVQNQMVDLESNLRTYEALIGYFGFARYGVTLVGTGKDGAPDQRTGMSEMMATAPIISSEIEKFKAAGQPLEPKITQLLDQVVSAANFAKFELFLFPPADKKEPTWLSAGNAIMNVMTDVKADPKLAISDIQSLETVARSAVEKEPIFREALAKFRSDVVARATARGEYKHVEHEVGYYKRNGFLYGMVWFLIGTVTALGMWAFGRGKIGNGFFWVTAAAAVAGAGYCVVAIVERCILMERPPVGNLYDTIIFIGTTVVLIALVVEWLTRRRFAIGLAPVLGAMLIILARRYELGGAQDHMNPLVAVLKSNYWLTIHVITITLGYTSGLLGAFVSAAYLLMRGLNLDENDKGLRRSITRAVYGMVCLTLFLSLVGTVLGGVWANDSWGRFWGWDPKENGALMIVLWTLAILHARLGGYIRDWGLHFASVATAAVVTFSWWHVNFLGVGLHNYGFTSGKHRIWGFYYGVLAILVFGMVVRFIENHKKKSEKRIGNADLSRGEV